MPIKGGSNISDTIDKLLDAIPGPQDGESVLGYKSRVNADVATIIVAVASKIAESDEFIDKHSDTNLADWDQSYSATKERFLGKDPE